MRRRPERIQRFQAVAVGAGAVQGKLPAPAAVNMAQPQPHAPGGAAVAAHAAGGLHCQQPGAVIGAGPAAMAGRQHAAMAIHAALGGFGVDVVTVGEVAAGKGAAGVLLVDVMDVAMVDKVAEVRLFKAEADDGVLAYGGTLRISGYGAWAVSCVSG